MTSTTLPSEAVTAPAERSGSTSTAITIGPLRSTSAPIEQTSFQASAMMMRSLAPLVGWLPYALRNSASSIVWKAWATEDSGIVQPSAGMYSHQTSGLAMSSSTGIDHSK